MHRTILLSLVFVHLAQTRGTIVSLGAGISIWLVFAFLVHTFDWTLTAAIAVNIAAFALCLPLVHRFRSAKMPLITRRWYDIPLRASIVATLVAIIVTLSNVLGPRISGVVALFPGGVLQPHHRADAAHRRAGDRRAARERPVGHGRVRHRGAAAALTALPLGRWGGLSASRSRRVSCGISDCGSTDASGVRASLPPSP